MNWTAQYLCTEDGRGAIWCGLELHICAVTAENGQLDGKKCLSEASQCCPAARLHIKHCGNQHDATSFRLVEFVASSLHHGRPQIRSAWELAARRHASWAKQQIMPLAKVAFIPTKPCMAPWNRCPTSPSTDHSTTALIYDLSTQL
jgi:hypothetical protein